MRIFSIIAITVVLLLANMPWFFSEVSQEHIYGFPPWAMYSLVMMVIFGVVVSILLGLYWTDLANVGGNDEIDRRNQSPGT
jgi:H+/Cl- antiporter ClcA